MYLEQGPQGWQDYQYMKTHRSLSSIQEYFSRSAPGYTAKTKSGVWDVIKRKEKDALWQLLKPHPEDVILDAGCGDGYYLSQLVELGCRAQGIDYSPMMVEEAKRNGLNVELADLEGEWAFGNKFDKVLCPGVLEFCRDAKKVLLNLQSVLKPEGYIVLLVPTLSFGGYIYKICHRIMGCGQNIELFSPKAIQNMAQASKLKVNEIIRATPLSMAVKLVTLP